MHAVQRRQLRAGGVELGGDANHLGVARRVEFFFFQRRRQDAHAQRFAQNQAVAHARIGIALDALGVHQTQGDQTINGLHRVDGVAPGNRNARRAANRSATFQNLANGLGGQHIDGHAHQRQRHDGRAAHGVDVGDGVGGGNAAKVKRIVHDGHEEVGSGNQRLLVVEFVDGCVVRRLNAHHQFLGNGHGRHAFQNV